MKLFAKFSLLAAAMVAMAVATTSCKEPDGPENPENDPKIPTVRFTHAPWEADAGSEIEIRATATIEEGAIVTVDLIVNDDGRGQTFEMTPTGTPDEYAASFAVSNTVGKKITYGVRVVSDENMSARTETVTLTSVAPGTASDNAAKRLRLSEIGTNGDYKFIEIYNPTGLAASLGDVSLWKNGELLHSFASSAELPPLSYGVFKAKESDFDAADAATELGTTEIGLSGSKSLSVELHFEDEVIDAFANTVNPGVGDMTANDWDGDVEYPDLALCDFFRKEPSSSGWYAIGGLADGSPGAPTPGADSAGSIRLAHQLFADDAVADAPYFDSVEINPDASPTEAPDGLTPDKNVIRFRAYSDVHDPDITVTCSVNGTNVTATHMDGAWYEIKPALGGGTTAGTPATLKISVTNSKGSYPAAGDEGVEVSVFPSGQTFGNWSDIRLNEIRTTDGDAIELYNTSPDPVVVAGMRIRKDKDRIFTIPGYMTMKGNGFAVLGCDDDVPLGTNYLVLGTVSNGLSGTKALLLELRRPKLAADPGDANGANIDSFVNTSIAAPDKDNWNDDAGVELPIPTGAGRAAGGVGTDGSGDWFVFNGMSIGMSNSDSAATGQRFTHKYSQAGGSDE